MGSHDVQPRRQPKSHSLFTDASQLTVAKGAHHGNTEFGKRFLRDCSLSMGQSPIGQATTSRPMALKQSEFDLFRKNYRLSGNYYLINSFPGRNARFLSASPLLFWHFRSVNCQLFISRPKRSLSYSGRPVCSAIGPKTGLPDVNSEHPFIA
jgi:hypothetical protein